MQVAGLESFTYSMIVRTPDSDVDATAGRLAPVLLNDQAPRSIRSDMMVIGT
jgi:hypothetical protein